MKKIVLLAAMAVATATAFAQQDSTIVNDQPALWRHNLQIGAGMGVHALLHHTADAKTNPYVGGVLDVQYQYMFTPHWGIGAGIGFSSLGSVDHLDAYGYTQSGLRHPDAVLADPTYDALVHVGSTRELQTAHMFNVPVHAVYFHPINQKWAIEARAGLMMGVLMASNYKASGNYNIEGYFPATGVTYSNLVNHDLNKHDVDEKGHNDLRRVNLSAQAEVGALWAYSEKVALYFGLYADYGMINMAKRSSQPLVTSIDVVDNQTVAPAYHGVMQSDRLTSDIHPFEFGVKVGVRLGLKDRIAAAAPNRVVETVMVHDTIVRTIHDTLTITRTDTVTITHEMIVAQQDSILQEILMSAHFNSRSYDPIFEEGSEQLFDQLKEAMTANPDNVILITGHTDSTGPADKNMELGQQRADAFKSALVRKGIEAARIITFSRGEEDPIAPNNTPEGRAANRRVQLKMK